MKLIPGSGVPLEVLYDHVKQVSLLKDITCEVCGVRGLLPLRILTCVLPVQQLEIWVSKRLGVCRDLQVMSLSKLTCLT